MTKTIIDIDDDLMKRAMEATGKGTKKHTVTEALELVVRRSEALKYIELLKGGLASGLDDPELIRDAQR